MKTGLPLGYRYKIYTCPECGHIFKANQITKHLKSGHKYPSAVDTVNGVKEAKVEEKAMPAEMYMQELENAIEGLIKSSDSLRNRLSIVLGPEENNKKKEEVEFFPGGASPLVSFLQKEIARAGLVVKSIDDIFKRLQV